MAPLRSRFFCFTQSVEIGDFFLLQFIDFNFIWCENNKNSIRRTFFQAFFLIVCEHDKIKTSQFQMVFKVVGTEKLEAPQLYYVNKTKAAIKKKDFVNFTLLIGGLLNRNTVVNPVVVHFASVLFSDKGVIWS